MSDRPISNSPRCLECRGLAVRRSGRETVVDVNLTLRLDECVAIVGPNGAGKTTLLHALAGLLPPASGAIQLDGHELHRISPRTRGQLVALVPQSLESVPAFTVRETVAGGRHPHVGLLGRLTPADDDLIEGAMARCGIAELAERLLPTLSGGERQKAMLAAAMAQDPQVLLLDEPNTALDPGFQLELGGILRAWHRGGRGVWLVSHDLQLPAALGGRVVAMRTGRVVAEGPASQVLTPDALGQIYGAPFGTATTPDGHKLVLPEWWRVAQ